MAGKRRFKVGDRVRVSGKPHMGMKHTVGTVREVSDEVPYAVEFDGMDEVHKWYVDDELEPGDEAEEGGAEGDRPGKGRRRGHMDMKPISAAEGRAMMRRVNPRGRAE